MNTLLYIILSTLIISLISFIGALILFLKEKFLNKILLFLVSLSAGALLGSAFFDLIPESLELIGFEEDSLLKIFSYLIIGFCSIFILEQFINWHHHHSLKHPEIRPFSYLILISDGIHNFLDGLIIAAAFMVNIPTGILTSLAVILHEIPQELGDFGVLIYSGFEKTKALLLNFLSGVMAVLGGIIGFFLLDKIENAIIFLVPFAAGSFIYIASADLIPEIKQNVSFKQSFFYFAVFVIGILMILFLKLLLGH